MPTSPNTETTKENYKNLSATTNNKLLKITKNYVLGITIISLLSMLRISRLNWKVSTIKDKKVQLSSPTISKFAKASILQKLLEEVKEIFWQNLPPLWHLSSCLSRVITLKRKQKRGREEELLKNNREKNKEYKRKRQEAEENKKKLTREQHKITKKESRRENR